MADPLRVLQVEDSEIDAAWIVRALEKAGRQVQATRVEDAAAMRAALEGAEWDVIISDYRLPQFDAPSALRLLQETGRDIPFLVVSGTITAEAAVETMRSGAQDYVLKDDLSRLAPAVDRELREAKARNERRRAERALERQTELVNLAHDAIITTDAGGTITSWNVGAAEMYGWTEAEALGKEIRGLLPTEGAVSEEIEGALQRSGRWEGELVETARDGRRIAVESRRVLVRGEHGAPASMLKINRDITARKRAEERVREAERAESVALLAGSIAHDFNNILTSISGNIELALEEMCPSCQVGNVLDIALESVQRAASLTNQLLAYSGKGAFARTPVSVSDAVQEAVERLRSSAPKQVEIRAELAAGVPPVPMDPGQMQLVLGNVILNGVEAIGEKPGRVTVRTGADAGGVRIEISDTGCGMDEETKKRIFEPFFTTKFFGRGLGLAAVQGIVKAMNGTIGVESAPGAGTRVEILVPLERTHAAPPQIVAERAGAPVGRGVLIVDDEPSIRKMAGTFLKKRGVTVFEAGSGKQAIERMREHGSEIGAVLLDMTMPEMNGHEALPAIRELSPGVRVIVSSGYSDADVKLHFSDLAVDGFLPKPYSAERLLELVRMTQPGD
jgi:PAS domain S-box-containing protein